jgi:hypothetical protein
MFNAVKFLFNDAQLWVPHVQTEICATIRFQAILKMWQCPFKVKNEWNLLLRRIDCFRKDTIITNNLPEFINFYNLFLSISSFHAM